MVIIFVFDPLAISLVIAANFAFSRLNPIETPKVEEQQYDPLDLNKDGIVDESEMLAAKQKIAEIEDRMSTQSLSGWRQRKLMGEIASLKSKIEEDQTKTY